MQLRGGTPATALADYHILMSCDFQSNICKMLTDCVDNNPQEWRKENT